MHLIKVRHEEFTIGQFRLVREDDSEEASLVQALDLLGCLRHDADVLNARWRVRLPVRADNRFS